ncbi:hypothetical protein Tco_0533164, partial [Tanacetum coccineum]
EIPTAPILPAPSAVVALSTDIISPIDAPPGIHRRQAILIRPRQDIPIGRLYRTHLGGPCRELTARKSVRPLHSHRLTLRYTSHHLDHFTSGSSSDLSSSGHSISDHSSSGHSSSRHSISGYSLSGHTPPDTNIADPSAPSRFVYPPLVRTSRCSEAYRRWRSALLSTMYPPTTSELSAGDSSSESSTGLSRNRCRSPAAIVTSYIHALRALVPFCADFLPPHKRFRDSILPEDSVEEDIDTDVLADIEPDATAVKVVVDGDVEAGVDAGIGMEVNFRVDVEDEVEDEVKSSDRGTMEVGVDVVVGIDIPDEDIETGQRELEARSLIADGERASLLEQVASLERSNARLRGTLRMEKARADRFRRHMSFMESELRQIRRLIVRPVIMTITRSGMTPEAIKELIKQRVAEPLAAYEANRTAKLAVESQSQDGDDDDNGNVGGNGNRNGEGNGDENGRGNAGSATSLGI